MHPADTLQKFASHPLTLRCSSQVPPEAAATRAYREKYSDIYKKYNRWIVSNSDVCVYLFSFKFTIGDIILLWIGSYDYLCVENRGDNYSEENFNFEV